MKIRFILSLSILVLFCHIAFTQNNEEVVVARKIKLNSTVLGEERTIYVSLPINYSQTNDSYPVLYILDGENSVITWAAGIVANIADCGLCPEMIIVAIGNTDRMRDLTPTMPTVDSKGNEIKYWPGEKLGEANKFLEFISTELFPFVEKNYRTVPYRIFSGHSAGGLCVTYTFLAHPNLFNGYIGISPSLQWDSNYLIRTAEEKLGTIDATNRQYYFSTGGKEDKVTIDNANLMVSLLNSKTAKGLLWNYDFLENDDHGSQEIEAFNNAIRFIFNGWKCIDDFTQGGLPAIQEFYKKRMDKFGFGTIPDQFTLLNTGFKIMRQGRNDEAFSILDYCRQLYPDFPDPDYLIAELFYSKGDKDSALKNMEIAINLAKNLNDQRYQRYMARLDEMKSGKK